jgi:hypothetical protein
MAGGVSRGRLVMLPEWGTQHAAGCYFGEGLYPQWVAVTGCTEPHPEASTEQMQGRPPIVWCDRLCVWCGFPSRPDWPHRLSIDGSGCMTGAIGDIVTALEAPEDIGHRYRVARMLRAMVCSGGINMSMCIVVGCGGIRSRGAWVCSNHADTPRCDGCRFQTLEGDLQVVENRHLCPGCANAEREAKPQ